MHDRYEPGHVSPVTCHDEINLLDYWKVIKKHRKMIVAIVAAASVLAVISSLLMTKMYRAEAVIIPVSSSGGGLSSMLGDMGGLAKLAGVKLPAGAAGDADKILAILKSRSIVESVIERENLMPILFEDAWDEKAGKWKSSDPKKVPDMEEAVKKMKDAVVIADDKKAKTIKITGTFKGEKLAARIVNAYLEQLQQFINSSALTTAKRNRIFIEEQLAENKEDLLEAGKEINEFYTRGRVSSTEAKVHVPIGRDQSPVVSGQDSVVSDQSPITNHQSQQLDSVISQKADIEKKIAEARTVRDVPQQVYLSYLMLRRELLGKVNALLTTQYEMAKIEESKEDLAFQVIDYAVPPVQRASPKRAQICIMSFFAALFLAIFIAFFREYLERMKAVEQQRRG